MSPATATPTTPARFSAPEFAHLRFVRWLYRSGRLVP
jgi:hypothetical protein